MRRASYLFCLLTYVILHKAGFVEVFTTLPKMSWDVIVFTILQYLSADREDRMAMMLAM